MLLFEGEPTFVNAEGVKWWLDVSTTKYAQRPDLHGTCLPDVVAYGVEFPDASRSRVLVENDQPIAEATGLEAIAVRIDIMKCLKRG
jgi:hypothetical protein